jgi:hypothetical protein
MNPKNDPHIGGFGPRATMTVAQLNPKTRRQTPRPRPPNGPPHRGAHAPQGGLVMPFGHGIQAGFTHATMVNCSPHGVGVTVAEPIPANSRMFLKFRMTTVALAIYTVKHCKPIANGYFIGAEYCGLVGADADRESNADLVYEALMNA